MQLLHDIWVLKPILELNVYVLAQVRYYVLETCARLDHLLAEAVKSVTHTHVGEFPDLRV